MEEDLLKETRGFHSRHDVKKKGPTQGLWTKHRRTTFDISMGLGLELSVSSAKNGAVQTRSQ